MSEHVDHVVVGGGVMGAATAWQLARRGRQVVLLERFGRGHTQGASHGASRIYRNTYARPEYLDLAQEAFGLWRVLEDEAPAVGELLTITGGVSQGSLRVARGRGRVRRAGHPARVAVRRRGARALAGPARSRGRAARDEHRRPAARRPRGRGVPPGRRRAPARGCCTRRRCARSSRRGDGVRVVTDTGTWHADERRGGRRRLDVRAARRARPSWPTGWW